MTGSLRIGRAGLTAVVAVALLLAGARPASAHEDDEEGTTAAEFVRQAIALIVNTPSDTEGIADKINDASEAEDASGVDVALVDEAGAAFAAGDVHQARALLERSIGAQPHINEAEPPPIRETTPTAAGDSEEMGEMGEAPGPAEDNGTPMTMATGDEPGTELIADSLETQPHLDGGDWALLASSIAVGLVGVWLGLRWRPGRRAAA
jgi:hypothetical protein